MALLEELTDFRFGADARHMAVSDTLYDTRVFLFVRDVHAYRSVPSFWKNTNRYSMCHRVMGYRIRLQAREPQSAWAHAGASFLAFHQPSHCLEVVIRGRCCNEIKGIDVPYSKVLQCCGIWAIVMVNGQHRLRAVFCIRIQYHLVALHILCVRVYDSPCARYMA